MAERQSCKQLIIKVIHIVLEFVAFICCLVAVCDDNHNHGCFHKHGWQWPFAFATCCISLIWWIFSIILGFCKCCSWGGQSTFVRDKYIGYFLRIFSSEDFSKKLRIISLKDMFMWGLLYHFVFASCWITVAKNSAPHVSANCFWWFDFCVFAFEAIQMAGLTDTVQVKGITDQGAPKVNK
ncbi:Oidioi.mRNA.OKI2018_I69.PAR.g12887.t1.cds [Oikopleura dioica]|uniref:Oidioi.mRNA.OKI2018_I69.PAR.g12887.t1.cds n=1 Tax=Oikopleura dioica TaxID=34765 RepID=A0ABN7S254_OIKDI|nr:Oidioi.mRNA.OKI2018_I69.PAR.g12887.t1.cds [Oikopleura dioica]